MVIDKFKDIRPYIGEEEASALKRIASHPLLKDISAYLFPGKDHEEFRAFIASLKSVDEFQGKVMLAAIQKIVKDTAKELTYSGLENLNSGKKHLLISNHRDILLDSALIQVICFISGIQTSEMAVGDNLITDSFLEDIARSNKMIKVVRSTNPRQLYTSSLLLSEYIRSKVSSGESSVWIAQRNGRTKDGVDMTEQGLLKMLDMSSSGDFVKDFDELSILPVSISYEYEPCDFLKARELYISRRTRYKKSPGEDLNSILTGIMQFKGNIHIDFREPLSKKEIESCAVLEKNEKYKALAEIIDHRIKEGYHIWNTNRIAYDIKNSTVKFIGNYTSEEKKAFESYCEFKTSSFDGDTDEIMDLFLSIYSNPAV